MVGPGSAKRLGAGELRGYVADRSQDEPRPRSPEEYRASIRLRSEGIGNGHAYLAAGVTRCLSRHELQPGSAKPKNTVKNENYAALVALDWGEKTHAFARQPAGSERIEQGPIKANPEALRAWLAELDQTHGCRSLWQSRPGATPSYTCCWSVPG